MTASSYRYQVYLNIISIVQVLCLALIEDWYQINPPTLIVIHRGVITSKENHQSFFVATDAMRRFAASRFRHRTGDFCWRKPIALTCRWDFWLVIDVRFIRLL